MSDRLIAWMRQHPIATIAILVVIAGVLAPQLMASALLTAINRAEEAFLVPLLVGGALYMIPAALFGWYPFRHKK